MSNITEQINLKSSSDLQIIQFLFQALGDCSKRNNYNWYQRYLHVAQLFTQSAGAVEYIDCISAEG